MTDQFKARYVLWGLLLMAIVFLPAVNYLQASLFKDKSNDDRVVMEFVKPAPTAEISVQEDSIKENPDYDPEWQREQSRLLRSFTWLEDELKLQQKNKELEIYQSYLGKLEKCPHADWECLEDTRWQLDDFAFSMQKVL